MQRTNATAHVFHGTRIITHPVNIRDDGSLWIYTAYNKAPRKLRKLHKSAWLYYNRYGVRYYVKLRIKAQGRTINEDHAQA